MELEDPSPAMPVKDGQNNTKSRKENGNGSHSKDRDNIVTWFKGIVRGKPNGSDLREAIEEYIVDIAEDESQSIAFHEKALISNVLSLRDLTVVDVMIPRADIVGVDITISHEDLLKLLAEKQHSRLPVFRETLDDIVGTIHIKDILEHLAMQKTIVIKDLVRDVPIVSPSMPVLDLLLQMRETKKHMSLVVDEYGGIDGLITIGDVIEAIVGEIDDEHDPESHVQLLENHDGTVTADARIDVAELEDKYGQFLDDEEREDVDTLGGLVFSIAGRVPARGEVIKHETGLTFEILDADPRRINKVKIKNLSTLKASDA